MDIKEITELGIEVAIVIGGGNIFRGVAGAMNGMDRVQGDHMGMLATVMNGVALTDYLNRRNIPTELFSAFEISGHVQGYRRDLAMQKMPSKDIETMQQMATTIGDPVRLAELLRSIYWTPPPPSHITLPIEDLPWAKVFKKQSQM